MIGRYAIYFAPPDDTPLERFGALWLGRDAVTGARLSRPAIGGFSADRLERITETPRGYGFHATLAPPMRMAEGCTRAMLDDALAVFAAARRPFRAPPLKLAALDDFLALVLSEASAPMQSLENDIIHTFHRFRAPPQPAEFIRRRSGRHTPRQEELLRQWGYPYVLDEFRFHMTLTCELQQPERGDLQRALAPLTAPLCAEPLEVNGIALFEQPEPGAPFRLTRRYPFSA